MLEDLEYCFTCEKFVIDRGLLIDEKFLWLKRNLDSLFCAIVVVAIS